MMLGILHHLLLADQIPMADVATLCHPSPVAGASSSGSRRPTCATSTFAAGETELYAHLDEELFVEQFTRHFAIMTREE